MISNKRFVLNILGLALMVYGAAMVPSVIIALAYGEKAALTGLAGAAVFGLVAGFALHRLADPERSKGELKRNPGRRNKYAAQISPRIMYMTTFFVWLVLTAIGAPVFAAAMPGTTFIDALLESAASLTTTGISAYDPAATPMSILLCRSTLNWLGGIGVIVIVLTIFPSKTFIGWGLASTEFPGPTFTKSGSIFRKGYQKIILIYTILTVVQFLLLVAAGMPAFAALLSSLSNISTSGLHHLNGGVITALSVPLKGIITVFSFLGSINCTLFLLLLNKKYSAIRESSELKFYLIRILVSVIFITGFIAAYGHKINLIRQAGDVLMQVVSFASTSGYFVTDCGSWPSVCITFILLQMFFGACSASTGGGIKCSRIIIALRTSAALIYRQAHPKSMSALMFDKKPLTTDQILRANLFIGMFMITYLGGALLLSAGGLDVASSLNYSQAMLTNTGTSIAEFASADSAAGFGPFAESVMIVLMVIGRLEIYPFVMLFLRNFWESDASV